MRTLFALLLISASSAFAQLPAASQLPIPWWQPLDNNGRPIAGGKICTYATSTFTPQATYSSNTAGVQLPNPIILDSTGRAQIWWGGANTYRVVFQQPGNNFCPGTGAVIWTADGIANVGELLKNALVATSGASLVGFEQPGGKAITVSTALNNEYFGDEFSTAQAALTRCPDNGFVTLSGTYSVANLTIPSNCHVVVPPGSVLKQSSNNPVFAVSGVNHSSVDGQGGGLIDGQFSQSAYSSSCVTVAGSSYITFTGLTVQNCGNVGIYFNGTSNVNSHVKVLNSNFASNQADAVYSQGLLYDQELAGNHADGSGNAANTHVFAVHYQQAGTTPPHTINYHDNVVVPGPNNAIEIGCFESPYPRTCWPYDVHLRNNTCLVSSAFSSGSSGPACDSLSDVDTFTIDNEIVDAQGNAFYQGPEIIGTNGTVHGQIQKNCASGQIGGMNLNQSAYVDVSDGHFCGQIYIGINGPAGNVLDIPMPGNKFHHNTVNLQPGFVAAATGAGDSPTPIHVQLNDVDSSITQLDVDHNVFTGLSVSDGTAAFVLENDPCSGSAVIDQVDIEANVFNLFQYGLAGTSCALDTNIQYKANHFGSGVAQFFTNYTFGSILADNFGFGHFSEGYTPTCLSGTGLDGAGGNPCATITGDYFEGLVSVTASGTPATASTSSPKIVFALTIPSGVFQPQPGNVGNIYCTFTPYFIGGSSPVYQGIIAPNTGFTTIELVTTSTLVATDAFAWNYRCH